ncbi:recombinase family protein [Bradyrhizobium shewense]|uniref:recombinase family protein n=1 Tax=Bradyrhizobium shewense TaxID=1761772 RepID=UPI003D31F650
MKAKQRFVAYYRVSTRKQGASGLGLEAQRIAVGNYLGDRTAKVVAEFTEVESGKRSDRPALDQALTAARVHQAALVVAKVDRHTRSVGFLSRLLEAGVDVRFADLPAVEGPILKVRDLPAFRSLTAPKMGLSFSGSELPSKTRRLAKRRSPRVSGCRRTRSEALGRADRQH